MTWSFDNFSPARVGVLARKKDVAIVFINSDSGEEYLTVDGNIGDR